MLNWLSMSVRQKGTYIVSRHIKNANRALPPCIKSQPLVSEVADPLTDREQKFILAAFVPRLVHSDVVGRTHEVPTS